MSALSHVYSDQTCRGGRRGRLSAQRQTLAALAVSAVAGLAIFATTAGSLMPGALAAAPAVQSPPPGWIDMAFADVDAISARPQQNQIGQQQSTQKQDTRKQNPCADFVYYFLNTNCSAKRVSSARGSVRRVVASRTSPVLVRQDQARNSDRVIFAATTTIATD